MGPFFYRFYVQVFLVFFYEFAVNLWTVGNLPYFFLPFSSLVCPGFTSGCRNGVLAHCHHCPWPSLASSAAVSRSHSPWARGGTQVRRVGAGTCLLLLNLASYTHSQQPWLELPLPPGTVVAGRSPILHLLPTWSHPDVLWELGAPAVPCSPQGTQVSVSGKLKPPSRKLHWGWGGSGYDCPTALPASTPGYCCLVLLQYLNIIHRGDAE